MNTRLVTYSYYQSNLLFYKEFGLNYHYREDPPVTYSITVVNIHMQTLCKTLGGRLRVLT